MKARAIFGTLLRVRALGVWRAAGQRLGARALVGVFLYLGLLIVIAVGALPLVQRWVAIGGAPALTGVFFFVQVAWLLSSMSVGFAPALLNREPLAHLPISATSIVLTDLLLVWVAPSGPPAILVLGSAALALSPARPEAVLTAIAATLASASLTALLIQGAARWRRRVAMGPWALVALVSMIGVFASAWWWAASQSTHPGGARLGIAQSVANLSSWIPSVAWPASVASEGAQGDVLASLGWLIASLILAFAGFAGVVAATRNELAIGRRRAESRHSGPTALGGSWPGGRFIALVIRELIFIRRNAGLLLPAAAVALLLALAVLRWPAQHVTAYLGVAPLLGILPLSTNAFGFDREAATALFALPVKPGTVLLAKNVAAACIAGSIFAVEIALGMVCGRLGTSEAVVALALFIAVAAAVLSVGNLLSVLNPRPMWPYVGGVPRSVGLAQVGQTFSIFLIIKVAPSVMSLLTPVQLVIASSAIALPMWLASWAYASSRLWQDRERLLAALRSGERL